MLPCQAKVELDRMIASVGQLPPAKEGIAVQPRSVFAWHVDTDC